MTLLCVVRVYPVLSLDTTTCFFLLRLVELSCHFIVSFLNFMMFSPCADLFCRFFASVFFNQLIRSSGLQICRLSSWKSVMACPFSLRIHLVFCGWWRSVWSGAFHSWVLVLLQFSCSVLSFPRALAIPLRNVPSNWVCHLRSVPKSCAVWPFLLVWS
jgi:hypothetical protein